MARAGVCSVNKDKFNIRGIFDRSVFMSLKERIEKRIIMVEYLIETNCNMQHFIKKFNVTTNIFYQLRVIANDNKKFEELKARLAQPRRLKNNMGEFDRLACSEQELDRALEIGIELMYSRGKTIKEIKKIFNCPIEKIEQTIKKIG